MGYNGLHVRLACLGFHRVMLLAKYWAGLPIGCLDLAGLQLGCLDWAVDWEEGRRNRKLAGARFGGCLIKRSGGQNL